MQEAPRERMATIPRVETGLRSKYSVMKSVQVVRRQERWEGLKWGEGEAEGEEEREGGEREEERSRTR